MIRKTVHCQTTPKNVVAVAQRVQSEIYPNLVLHHPVGAQFSRGARAMWAKFRGNCLRRPRCRTLRSSSAAAVARPRRLSVANPRVLPGMKKEATVIARKFERVIPKYLQTVRFSKIGLQTLAAERVN